MKAAIATASPSPEMISRREYRVAVGIEIKIGRRFPATIRSICGNDFSDLGENFGRIVHVTRNAGDGFQARTAKTRRVDGMLSQAGEDIFRHDDLMTPTGAFVEMSFGNATFIFTRTERASLILGA